MTQASKKVHVRDGVVIRKFFMAVVLIKSSEQAISAKNNRPVGRQIVFH